MKNTFLIIITTILTTICIHIISYQLNNNTFAKSKNEILEKLQIEEQYTSDDIQKKKIQNTIQKLSVIKNEGNFYDVLKIENEKLNTFYKSIKTDEIKKNISKNLEEEIVKIDDKIFQKQAKQQLEKINQSKNFTEYQKQIGKLYDDINARFSYIHKNAIKKPDTSDVAFRENKKITAERFSAFYGHTNNEQIKKDIDQLLSLEDKKSFDILRDKIEKNPEFQAFEKQNIQSETLKNFKDELSAEQIAKLKKIPDTQTFQKEFQKTLFENGRDFYLNKTLSLIQQISDDTIKVSLLQKYETLSQMTQEETFHTINNDILEAAQRQIQIEKYTQKLKLLEENQEKEILKLLVKDIKNNPITGNYNPEIEFYIQKSKLRTQLQKALFTASKTQQKKYYKTLKQLNTLKYEETPSQYSIGFFLDRKANDINDVRYQLNTLTDNSQKNIITKEYKKLYDILTPEDFYTQRKYVLFLIEQESLLEKVNLILLEQPENQELFSLKQTLENFHDANIFFDELANIREKLYPYDSSIPSKEHSKNTILEKY
ncbi:hypothetical protein KGV52_00660 [Candidatus Gracilibacteria bacterium]|nr:hypothetical protein [Candidatus Gracilibacteria bacterium]